MADDSHIHEWRLVSTWTDTKVISLSPPGNYTTVEVTNREWYCVHCRVFEITEEE
jgi:hypothetical protein